jgi:hypothetical protein
MEGRCASPNRWNRLLFVNRYARLTEEVSTAASNPLRPRSTTQTVEPELQRWGRSRPKNLRVTNPEDRSDKVLILDDSLLQRSKAENEINA